MPVDARRDEDGFTMIVTVIGMALIALLVLVAVTAVNGDAQLTSRNLSRTQAYEAAKAGIDDYAYHLHVESGYWSHCTEVGNPTEPSAVNQIRETTHKRSLPGVSGASYAIELLPAENPAESPEKTCDPTSLATATASMLQSKEPLPGTFRIRSNGYAGDSHVAITATFKPASFLDYVYFTQYETSDPVSYSTEELKYGAEHQCETFIREGRTETPLKNKAGQVMNERGGVWHSGERQKYCSVISFVGGDDIQGPMHTNDAFVICGEPTLGRGPRDPIEVGEGEPGWYSTGDSRLNSGFNCGGSEKRFKGEFRTNATVIVPPATNSELESIAEPAYSFSGETSICLEPTSISVGHGRSCSEATLPYPTNGVIYVSGEHCPGAYTPFDHAYTTEASPCANANVKGEYSQPLTIAAGNDVVITGNVTKTDEEGMLGLIANNFIRVYHPLKQEVCEWFISWHCHEVDEVTECRNGSGVLGDLTIEAALLAIEHSFIVDNYDCGAELGTLTVKGAIAQKFRGAVGTTGGTGYIKNYEYDQRLKTTEPPSFIQPIESDWVIGRETTE